MQTGLSLIATPGYSSALDTSNAGSVGVSSFALSVSGVAAAIKASTGQTVVVFALAGVRGEVRSSIGTAVAIFNVGTATASTAPSIGSSAVVFSAFSSSYTLLGTVGSCAFSTTTQGTGAGGSKAAGSSSATFVVTGLTAGSLCAGDAHIKIKVKGLSGMAAAVVGAGYMTFIVRGKIRPRPKWGVTKMTSNSPPLVGVL